MWPIDAILDTIKKVLENALIYSGHGSSEISLSNRKS